MGIPKSETISQIRIFFQPELDGEVAGDGVVDVARAGGGVGTRGQDVHVTILFRYQLYNPHISV